MKTNTYIALPLLVIGIALTAFSFVWLNDHREVPPPVTAVPAVVTGGVEGWVPVLEPSPQPAAAAVQAPPPPAPIVRVTVPRVGINAAVEILSLDGSGAMQDPRTPNMVAWYDFSARPGQPGNVVMAGHVDYHNYGPAVFWRLRDLKRGDRIELHLADGAAFSYEVASLKYYDAATAPVQEITGQTSYEAITLITCGGSFNRSSRSYNQRLIVRATRIANSATSP
jgi:LPXTG-site transpeptidase (sortase) family protein